jgi:hypothetical protein
MKTALTLLFLVLFLAASAFAGETREELARQVVSTNDAAAEAAIKVLRAMGRDGLDSLFTAYSAEITSFVETGSGGENWTRIARAIDSVAMQRDAYASGLYWYTDLEAAKKAAELQKKPILSLRLLGNLNEEFSCANSRFFRALLYSNSEISKYLRENYILHWRSVRPAPKVTIDFGDGRKIERTITGNSIHYILSENGEVIEALPGLYSPQSFLAYITEARGVNKGIRGLSPQARRAALLTYRKKNFDRIRAKRESSVAAAKVKLVEQPLKGDRAIDIAGIAVTKMITETSILTSISDDFSRYEPGIRLDEWEKLAKVYSPNPGIDPASTSFIRRQNKEISSEDFAVLISKLNKYVSLDTTRNDFLLHTRLYSWLNQGRGADLESLNAEVYAQIFKTPDSDKWLGLYSNDVYTALDGNGVRDKQ